MVAIGGKPPSFLGSCVELCTQQDGWLSPEETTQEKARQKPRGSY